MFMACVVHPGRISTTVVFAAAASPLPEYDEEGSVTSKELPPYEIVEGIPDGTGRVVAAKYGG